MGAGHQGEGQHPGKDDGASTKGKTTDEKTSLRSKKEREDRVCFIKSRLAITVLTRVVFLVLTLSCVAVITTSIWLMLNCRESFATVRPMIPEHALFCTNMGMPALFACCTVLFTVFGLGCTGRRLTGYALIIISSVEILQSVTTLAFYKCNTIGHQDIVDTVNASLIDCHMPLGFPTPLFHVPEEKPRPQNTSFITDELTKRGVRMHSTTHIIPSSSDYLSHNLAGKHIKAFSVHRPNAGIHQLNTEAGKNSRETHIYFELREKKLIEEFNNKMRVPVSSGKKTQPLKTNGLERSQVKECSVDSPYFIQLGQKLRFGDVQECLEVCHTYYAVCPSTKDPLRASQVPVPQRSKQDFDKEVLYCSDMVREHVNNLCFYNDEIIIPISICAPTLYICLSLCFIYLCRCDRRLKEFGPIEISGRGDPVRGWSWRNISCCDGESYGCQKSSPWSCAKLKASIPLTSGMSKRSHGAFSSATINSCSSSTHELLHMTSMPSKDTPSLNVSHGVSRDTINTLLSDEPTGAAAPK